MRPLPPELPGVDNDLADVLDHHVLRAIADDEALVYVGGARWASESARDPVLGFRLRPESGLACGA